jgi:RNA polymerase sigma factor (sigma-70 family)
MSEPERLDDLPEIDERVVVLQDPEADLVAKQDAFAEIVKEYYAKIQSYILRMTQSDELALDITQEVFTCAWENISALRSPNPAVLTAWLTRIAYNITVTSIRSQAQRNRRAPISHLEDLQQDEIYSQISREKFFYPDDPAELFIQREPIDIASDIGERKPQYARALILNAMGFSSKEIERILNQPSKLATEALMFRAAREAKKLRDI